MTDRPTDRQITLFTRSVTAGRVYVFVVLRCDLKVRWTVGRVECEWVYEGPLTTRGEVRGTKACIGNSSKSTLWNQCRQAARVKRRNFATKSGGDTGQLGRGHTRLADRSSRPKEPERGGFGGGAPSPLCNSWTRGVEERCKPLAESAAEPRRKLIFMYYLA